MHPSVDKTSSYSSPAVQTDYKSGIGHSYPVRLTGIKIMFLVAFYGLYQVSELTSFPSHNILCSSDLVLCTVTGYYLPHIQTSSLPVVNFHLPSNTHPVLCRDIYPDLPSTESSADCAKNTGHTYSHNLRMKHYIGYSMDSTLAFQL